MASTKDSFDERLDRIIMETLNERETIEQRQASARKLESLKQPHLSIDTSKDEKSLKYNAQNASIMTP